MKSTIETKSTHKITIVQFFNRVSLTADLGVASLIPARSHTFVEIDHEMISMVILLLPLIQEGLLSVTSESMCTKYWLTLPREKVWLG